VNAPIETARPGLLVVDRFTAATEARFADQFAVFRTYEEGFSLPVVAPGIQAVATSGGKGVGRDVLDALPALEIIAIRGVGTDAVDLDWACAHEVVVTTTPGLLTDDVADLAIGLLLALCRRICPADRFVRDGSWRPGTGLPLGRKLTGLRLGFVGLGRVGRAIAARAAAFRTSIAYTDIRPVVDVSFDFVPDVPTLAARSDVLLLAASGGPQSKGIVDGAVLTALGPAGLLVNVARGSLVDEPALVEALVAGRLGGAALDVFANEPDVPATLRALDNVVLQPHRASATEETRQAMEDLVVENLAAHFAGLPLPTPVS
jgi:lactate dehydrogenase-like 2-hydroxyacid dehydrogenase